MHSLTCILLQDNKMEWMHCSCHEYNNIEMNIIIIHEKVVCLFLISPTHLSAITYTHALSSSSFQPYCLFSLCKWVFAMVYIVNTLKWMGIMRVPRGKSVVQCFNYTHAAIFKELLCWTLNHFSLFLACVIQSGFWLDFRVVLKAIRLFCCVFDVFGLLLLLLLLSCLTVTHTQKSALKLNRHRKST